MDKAEYQQKLEELTACVEDKDYAGALSIANSVDWRRVKSVKTLSLVADVYEHEKDYEKTKEILTIAQTRTSIGRGVLSRLVEICLQLGQVEQAEKYFRDFTKVAQNDNSKYVLQYQLYKAKGAPLDAQISVLEEYREKEYTERWAYELAELYACAGERDKCIDACDDLILWFSEGKYVLKAMELKKQYEPLSERQQVLYTRERDAENERARQEAAEKAAAEAAAAARKEEEEKRIAEQEAAMKAAAEAEEREREAARAEERTEAEAMRGIEDAKDEAREQAEAISRIDETAGSHDFPKPTPPEGSILESSLLKTFQSMFGGKKTDGVQENAEAAKDEAPAGVPEEDLKVRELVKEEEVISEAAPAADAGSTPVVPLTETEPKKEFDLKEFLHETAGSFSEEIETGDYKATTEEAPARLDEEENTPEEEAAEKAEIAAENEALTETDTKTVIETIQPAPMDDGPSAEKTDEEAPVKRMPHYIEELEIPDEEPTEEEKKSRTIPLGTIGQNTIPISIEKILSEETPEEQRIRILNKARPTRMSEEQRKVFTYFARIPGMDSQILEAISSVYEHAGERTSLHGNIGVMGDKGTGKTRLTEGLIITMCRDLDLNTAKIARISGEELNTKDPAKVVDIMTGGFLMIEDISKVNEETIEKLNKAMEFRTDCMIVIIEDEKSAMRAFLKNNPVFAAKFDKMISIPVFTNDELVTFARTYAAENDCQIDDLGILALYTRIGSMQSEEKPVTISEVRDMVDRAIEHAGRGRRRRSWGRDAKRGDTARMTVLHEKDFE